MMFTPHLVHLTNCQAEGRKHISEADLVPSKPAEFTPAFESGCDCWGRIYIRAGFAALGGSPTLPPRPAHPLPLLHSFAAFAAKRKRNQTKLWCCLVASLGEALWLVGEAQVGPKARAMVGLLKIIGRQ